MILVAHRGEAFQEPFVFKNEKGQVTGVPIGTWSLILTRADFVKEFSNLPAYNGGVVWKMTAAETADLPYSNFSVALYLDGKHVTSGVLQVR